jgi:hypothetical protein
LNTADYRKDKLLEANWRVPARRTSAKQRGCRLFPKEMYLSCSDRLHCFAPQKRERHRLFPRAVLRHAPPAGLTTSQQAVARVRERKPRQEGEGLPATGAATATDANPVVMRIVRLLAAAAVTDDRIAFTNGHRRRMASAQLAAQSVSSLCGGTESGIKRIVAHGSSARAWTCQDLSRKRSSSP